MEHASVESIISRLKQAVGVTQDKELATALGISGKAISAAKRRGVVPSKWILQIEAKSGVSSAILTAYNEKLRKVDRPIRQVEPMPDDLSVGEHSRYARLEEKIDKLEQQRDELSAEVHRLLKENGDLRVDNATLRERLKAVSGRGMATETA